MGRRRLGDFRFLVEDREPLVALFRPDRGRVGLAGERLSLERDDPAAARHRSSERSLEEVSQRAAEAGESPPSTGDRAADEARQVERSQHH